jgi:GT2 family glycosyltransferase
MKYSIIMPYHRRAGQLHNTLVSFCHFYGKRDDFEVVIVEDRKNRENPVDNATLRKVIKDFKGNLEIKLIQSDWGEYNPAPLFNDGADYASGEFFVITSPECMHRSDVLGGFDEEFMDNPEAYVVCACESAQNSRLYIESYINFNYQHHRWYQHSVYRPTRYHFCSALSRDSWREIGGFDERFGKGIAYDDNDFKKSIEKAGLIFRDRDDLLVVHIEHGRERRGIPDYTAKHRRNRELYQKKWGDYSIT